MTCYELVKKWKKKYPGTIAWRLFQNSKIIDMLYFISIINTKNIVTTESFIFILFPPMFLYFYYNIYFI